MEHNKRIKKEALVEAIADKGAKILSSEKRTGFRKFLSDFWKAIKGALAKVGIHIDTKGGSLADATLEQYTDAVARQMIEGRSNLPRPAGNVVGDVVTTAQQAAESIDAQIVMPTAASRPITNKTASGIASFRDQVESKKAKKAMKAEDVADIVRTLEQLYAPLVDIVIGLAPGSKTTNTLLQPQNSGPFKGNPGTMYDPVSKTFNPELMEEVAKKIKGKKYKYDDLTTSLHKILIGGRATADWFDAVAGDDSYIDDNGEFVKADEYTETNSLTEAFKTIADHKGPWGYLTKLLNSKAAGVLTLPETVADWLDPTGQTGLKDMLVKWRRAHADRAAEIALHRQQQIDPLTEKFKGLSLFDGKNSASNVATKTYPGWANGKAADVTLPVGSWMHMLATHKSQLVSHKGRSSVVADISPLTGNLITLRYGADAEGHSYGWDYADPVTGKTTTYLVEAKTLDTIEADIQATPEHKSAYDDGRNFFKFQKALDYVGGLYRLVNGEEMETYDDYFPTSSVAEGGDVRTQMPTLIEKTKITQAREGLPMRVRGNDMLAEIQSYARREEHYIANVAVTLNLIRWMKRHSDTMGQLAPKWLKEELKNLQEDLNDPSARAKKQGNVTEVSIGGIDVGFRPMLRRFTTSVFSVSPALPLKQVMTMMQGVGLGIVENRFLAQATLKDLAPLFKEAYHIARQGDENAIYGTKLAEVAFINEMAQYPKLTTVLQRMIGRSEAFIGGSSLDDIKANPYSGTVNAVRKGLHTISDYGLGAVRRSDRAVIISFFKAAQYQVADDIAKGKLTDAAGNAVTDVNSDEAKDRVSELTEALVYDTNQMNSELDRTPLQRDRSLASTLIGLYSGQQQRLLNSFIQRYARWIHAPAGAQKNEAFNQMLWVGFNNIALNAALMALISMMWRMLMKTITGDKRPEEYAQTFAWDTARGILGSFPSIPTEGLVMLTTMTDNQKWSSGLIEYAPGEAVAQVINGMQQSVRYFGEEDEAKKQRLLNQIIYNLADGGTKLTGLPNNIGRIIGKMAKSSPKKQEEFTEAQFEEMIVEEAP